MIRAFQWDLARQVERLDWLQAQLPRYADWGYEELYLHLEDAVEYPSLPGVARADAYSYRDLEKLSAAATRAGIRIVPIVNLLGHTQYLIKTADWRDLNELRAPDGSPLEYGQICPLHPRTLEVAAKLFRDIAPFCTAGKVHAGLDESFHLGRHPRSRVEIARIGLGGHFAAHVRRLHGLARSLGLRLGLWADMLALLPDAIPFLPRDVVAYDWYYYPFGRRPRMELHNFAEYDLAAPLHARGIEYWGCPMNGAFRHEPLPVFGDRLANLQSWWARCRSTGAGGFLVCSWEAQNLAIEMTTVIDAAAACLWLDPGIGDHTEMLAKGFERVFGRGGAREAARAALRCDHHAFAGYARWEINERWDGCARPRTLAPYNAELRFFDRLARQHLPEPFAASVAFRRYLAARDVFVREAVRGVYALRGALRRGADAAGFASLLESLQARAAGFHHDLRAARRAARRMWCRSRDPRRRGRNELLLGRDERRLREWRRWLVRCAAQPAIAAKATPVCGPWQLEFAIHNHTPALQKVVVERQAPDGTWHELAGRFTVEFRACAARPRARITREMAVPVPAPGDRLRIAVRGVGRVAVSHIALTDGLTQLKPRGRLLRQRTVLGRPAARRGFPSLDWTRNTGVLHLEFPAP